MSQELHRVPTSQIRQLASTVPIADLRAQVIAFKHYYYSRVAVAAVLRVHGSYFVTIPVNHQFHLVKMTQEVAAIKDTRMLLDLLCSIHEEIIANEAVIHANTRSA